MKTNDENAVKLRQCQTLQSTHKVEKEKKKKNDANLYIKKKKRT